MSSVATSQRDGVVLLRFVKPILSVAVLDELESTLDTLARGTTRLPLVLSSSHERIFLAGANLHEIAALGPASSRPYARRGRRVLDRLARLPVPTVAAIHGACAGGGLDLALSCDLIVTGTRAHLSHPGVRRGLVTGWGGTTLLPALVGRSAARRSLLEASPLAIAESSRRGVSHSSRQDALAAAIAAATRLASLHPVRLSLWRALRQGPFVDRFRTFVVHNEL